jgi:hypothetical protein
MRLLIDGNYDGAGGCIAQTGRKYQAQCESPVKYAEFDDVVYLLLSVQ